MTLLNPNILIICRCWVFQVVDCRFPVFFVDVDLPLQFGCRCKLNGGESCNLQFDGPPYVPPLTTPPKHQEELTNQFYICICIETEKSKK